jgi:hypothetical protein
MADAGTLPSGGSPYPPTLPPALATHLEGNTRSGSAAGSGRGRGFTFREPWTPLTRLPGAPGLSVTSVGSFPGIGQSFSLFTIFLRLPGVCATVVIRPRFFFSFLFLFLFLFFCLSPPIYFPQWLVLRLPTFARGREEERRTLMISDQRWQSPLSLCERFEWNSQ